MPPLMQPSPPDSDSRVRFREIRIPAPGKRASPPAKVNPYTADLLNPFSLQFHVHDAMNAPQLAERDEIQG